MNFIITNLQIKLEKKAKKYIIEIINSNGEVDSISFFIYGNENQEFQIEQNFLDSPIYSYNFQSFLFNLNKYIFNEKENIEKIENKLKNKIEKIINGEYDLDKYEIKNIKNIKMLTFEKENEKILFIKEAGVSNGEIINEIKIILFNEEGNVFSYSFETEENLEFFLKNIKKTKILLLLKEF